jgi:hypothetical protein
VVLGHADGLVRGQDAELVLTFFDDDPDFRGADALVDAGLVKVAASIVAIICTTRACGVVAASAAAAVASTTCCSRTKASGGAIASRTRACGAGTCWRGRSGRGRALS